jgi:hypothetical protein
LRLTAGDLVQALRRRHAEERGEWANLTEFLLIDFLAIRCWSAGIGFRRVAYEIKVDRGDFRRELQLWPRKAQAGLELGHQFIFAVPRGLLRDDELQAHGPDLEGKRLWVPAEAGLVEFGWGPEYDDCDEEQIETLRAVGEIDGRDLVARLVRRAPLRRVPALGDREVALALRHRLMPNPARMSRREAEHMREAAKRTEERLAVAREHEREAEERLAEVLGPTVEAGQVWRGEMRSVRPGEPREEARVRVVSCRGGFVRIEALDEEFDPSYVSFMPVGRFLARFQQARLPSRQEVAA